jgi:Flp pilus assembly protein TadD
MFLREQQTDAKGKLEFSGPLAICLLLVAMTLAVYWPAVHCDFLNIDDTFYFTANHHVQTGLKPANIVWAFTTGYSSNWHPLTWLSLMLDAELFGKGPSGPHFTNLLLHLANTVLVFLLFRRLTAATWRSAFVAALFAWHPLHVESVAWIAERKDVLSTFFGLWALLFYAVYAQGVTGDQPSPGSGTGGTDRATQTESIRSRFTFHVSRSYWLALLFFVLSLMSKPMLVTLPLVMLLLDWWPLQRIADCGLGIADAKSSARSVVGSPLHKFNRLLVEKWPFFLLSAISCVVTFIVQQKGGSVASLMKISLAGRIENIFVSYARYLGKTFWPVNLAVLYPHPGHWDAGLVVFSLLLFIGLSVAAVWLGRKHPYVPVGWYWFVGTLVPVIGLVQVGIQSMADRYTYLPLMGVFLVVAWSFDEARVKWRLPESLVIFLMGTILLAGAGVTRSQLSYWRDSETLFRHTLAVTENNYLACNNLGTSLSEKGQLAEAIDCFQRSLRIKPDNADALCNMGNAMTRSGRWNEAVDYYHRALQINPDQADVLSNLGMVLVNQKQYAGAMAYCEQAVRVNPDSPTAHNNLATVLFIERRFDEAARHYREALRLQPDNPQIYSNLGDTLLQLGQAAAAVEFYQAALRLNPNNPQIKARLQSLDAPISN